MRIAVDRSPEESTAGWLTIVHPRHYIIFYRLIGPDIEIIRVIHGRRDLGRIFNN